MREIDRGSARLLRSILRDRLEEVPGRRSERLLEVFDAALERFNCVAARPRTARQCSRCRTPSVRGEYRKGKKIWICRDCLKKEGILHGQSVEG